MKLKKILFIIFGCLCFSLGTVGVILPILPSTPFYLATLFFFANSSEKLHRWFLGTKLYKKHLESFVKKRGMLMKTKIMADSYFLFCVQSKNYRRNSKG